MHDTVTEIIIFISTSEPTSDNSTTDLSIGPPAVMVIYGCIPSVYTTRLKISPTMLDL